MGLIFLCSTCRYSGLSATSSFTVSAPTQVICSGLQVFHRNGEVMEEVTEFRHTMPSSSRPTQSYLIRELTPNTHYTCQMVSVAGRRVGKPKPGSAVEFTTGTGSKIIFSLQRKVVDIYPLNLVCFQLLWNPP